MTGQATEWLSAASCAEGPRPAVTFADLPRQHQGEVVRFALVAGMSTAYFVTLCFLAWPLPSRNLTAQGTLPHPGISRPPVVEARLTRPLVEPGVFHPRTLRSRPAVELASLREQPASELPPSPAPRRNLFSRFFRGVLRTVQPGRSQADPF